jgi:hypothetical protein
MPLIVGMNIHDSAEVEWRTALGDVIEKFTMWFWGLKTDDVTCFFAHDPSVPPGAVATFTVELLFNKDGRSSERRHQFSKELGEKLEVAVREIRCRLDDKPPSDLEAVRVEVACKPFDHEHNGFYITPKPDETSSEDTELIQSLSKRLDQLEITPRTLKCLAEFKRANLVYVWQLAQMTESEALKIPDFGKKSKNEMIEILAQMELRFGMSLHDMRDQLPSTPED